MQCIAVQCSAGQWSTMQWSAVQCSVVQQSQVHHPAASCRMVPATTPFWRLTLNTWWTTQYRWELHRKHCTFYNHICRQADGYIRVTSSQINTFNILSFPVLCNQTNMQNWFALGPLHLLAVKYYGKKCHFQAILSLFDWKQPIKWLFNWKGLEPAKYYSIT